MVAAAHRAVLQDMEAVRPLVHLDMEAVRQLVHLDMAVELRRHQQRRQQRPFSMRAKC